MSVSRRFLLAGGAATALAGCSSPWRKVSAWVGSEPWVKRDEGAMLARALDDLATAMLREQPDRATSLVVSEAQAGGRYMDRLADQSGAGLQRRAGVMANALGALGRVSRGQLLPADKVSIDVVQEALSNWLAGARFGWGNYGFGPPTPYVVTQLSGSYIEVPTFLDTHHQLKTPADADAYLSRLAAYAGVLDQETARIKADAAKNVVPPDFAIDGAIAQLKGFAAKPAGETILVQSLKRRIGTIEGFDGPHTEKTVQHATSIVADKILPAYRSQIEALQGVRGRAAHDAGIWRLKDGDQFYATALRAWTTSALAPDEIHNMGLDLEKDLGVQMEAILVAQGLTKGTLTERIAKLTSDPKELYPNNDAGRAQLIDDLNRQIAALQPLLAENFATLPKAKLEVRRVPPFREAGAPGGYYEFAALDGSRPGYYYINLRNTAEWPRFALPTLTYHEGEPGHHWQISIAHEAGELPLVRKALINFSGYAEGWGLYAEELADEMGAYKDNPLGRLGYLQSAAFRAARLVADTGLHVMRWSREQAIEHMVEATGNPRTRMTTEVERYAVWPGQACAYMIGRETIRSLREKAKTALGVKFDIRRFHDVVLRNGSVPLGVLDGLVKAWVEAELAPTSASPKG
jgi:uncharacterized protein (DUF885 family)